jgi:hypothetical protein
MGLSAVLDSHSKGIATEIEAKFSILAFPLPFTFEILKGGATDVEGTSVPTDVEGSEVEGTNREPTNLEGGGTNLEATDVELKGGSTDIELKLEPNEIDGSRKIDRKVA